MKAGEKKSQVRIMRALHRDIGFLVIGLTVIYCISGIMLTYRDTSFLKTESQVEIRLDPQLTADQVKEALGVKIMKVTRDTPEEIGFIGGRYDKVTGAASYTSQQLPYVLDKFNAVHKTPSAKGTHPFTVLYGVLLLFLAISSFWMYKAGTKLFRRGIVLAVVGVVAAIVLMCF